MAEPNDTLEEARKHVLTTDSCFGVDVGKHWPTVVYPRGYDAAEIIYKKLNDRTSMLFPISDLMGEESCIAGIMKKIGPLLDDVYEKEEYIRILRGRLLETREMIIKARNQALSGVLHDDGPDSARSANEALTALTPEEKERVMAT